MNQDLYRKAASQYGLFTIDQATTRGVSDPKVRRWVKAGRLLVPHPAVFALPGVPDSWERSVMTAVLAAGPEAVASHRSAARLWDLYDDDDDTVEITVTRNGGARPKGAVVHRSRDLVGAHSMPVRGIPATKPLRMLVDLGAVLPADKVEDVLDRALIRKLITVAGVEWMRNELTGPGRRGAGVIGRVLDGRALGASPPHGMLEPRMAGLLKRAGLPPAIFQYRICDPDTGLFLAQVDFGYPPPDNLVIEVDGFEVHGTPRAMAKDFVRQNGLVPYGWRVLRFTWEQVVHQPAMVSATIARVLRTSA